MAVTYGVDGKGAVLTSFGLLSGVAARAMPALSRSLYSLTVTKVAGASVLALEPDLLRVEQAVVSGHLGEQTAAQREEEAHGELVTLDRVSFRYPTATANALRDVSL